MTTQNRQKSNAKKTIKDTENVDPIDPDFPGELFAHSLDEHNTEFSKLSTISNLVNPKIQITCQMSTYSTQAMYLLSYMLNCLLLSRTVVVY